MKSFFITVFGGIVAVAFGVSIAYGGSFAWRYLSPNISTVQNSKISANTISSEKTLPSNSYISGLTRKVTFTADQEEDFFSAATLSLPKSADKNISASGYIVKNLVRGDTVIQHNAEVLMPIASLTKLVTAVVAMKNMNPEERITLSKKITAVYGNTAGFRVGETFRTGDLLYPLLMVSSNDAAEAFAQKYGRQQFIQAMNDFVQSIGAYRTYFADPSGLSKENVSTANDLITIIDWIRKNQPDILNITRLKSKTIRNHVWVNPTHFLSWSYYVGGKNGYTPEADRTTVSLFALGKNNNPYAIVVLGSNARDNDVMKLLRKVVE